MGAFRAIRLSSSRALTMHSAFSPTCSMDHSSGSRQWLHTAQGNLGKRELREALGSYVRAMLSDRGVEWACTL